MTGKLETYTTCVHETQNTFNLNNSVNCKGQYSLKELSAQKLNVPQHRRLAPICDKPCTSPVAPICTILIALPIHLDSDILMIWEDTLRSVPHSIDSCHGTRIVLLKLKEQMLQA